MKNIPECKFCGSIDHKILFPIKIKGTDANIVECKNCKLTFLNRQFDLEEIKSFYRQDYFKDHIKSETLRFLEENAARLFERLKKYTAKPGKILDIGAATGSYLSVFKKGGWEVFGIELSDYIRDVARRVYSLSLFPDLKTAAFPDDYFDLIIMIQVIEHISDPMDIIQNVARVLKPGGILYISTPNFASLNAQKMKAEWPSLHPGEHLFFYTPNTIKNILMKCNLKIIKIETMQLLVTGFHLNRVFGQKQSGYIVKVSNVLFSGLKRKLREWLGKILPGDGLEVIARKE